MPDTHLNSYVEARLNYQYLRVGQLKPDIRLDLISPEGASISMVQGAISLEPEGIVEAAFFIEMPPEVMTGRSTPVIIKIVRDNVTIDELNTSFLGPDLGSNR